MESAPPPDPPSQAKPSSRPRRPPMRHRRPQPTAEADAPEPQQGQAPVNRGRGRGRGRGARPPNAGTQPRSAAPSAAAPPAASSLSAAAASFEPATAASAAASPTSTAASPAAPAAAPSSSATASHTAAPAAPPVPVSTPADRACQEEEIEVLQAIYADDFHMLQPLEPADASAAAPSAFPSAPSQSPCACAYSIRLASWFEAHVRVPHAYPSAAPPEMQLRIEPLPSESIGGRLCADVVPSYDSVLASLPDRLWSAGASEPLVYTFLEQLREEVLQAEVERRESVQARRQQQRAAADIAEHDALLAAEALLVAQEAEAREAEHAISSFDCDGSDGASARAPPPEDLPAIYSDEPFTDRKSTFQAHVARVRSAGAARAVLAELLSHNKIARATHNMYAYVVREGGALRRENDDDGEAQAGARLAHLLHILASEDLMVVVSRWYGGILLGADRFKHINNCARAAIEAHAALYPEEGAEAQGQAKAAAKDKKPGNTKPSNRR